MSNSSRGVPLPSSTSGGEGLSKPLVPRTSSLDDIIDQADTELDFILEAEAGTRSEAPSRNEAQTFGQAVNPEGHPHLEGNDFVFVLNPDFFNEPPMSGIPSSLTTLVTRFILKMLVSHLLRSRQGGDTPVLPFIFPNLYFASGSRVLIPSSPFSTSPGGG